MPDVCVVIPCFNEELRLRSADFLAFLDAHPRSALCLVDDGSTDRTLAVLHQLQSTRPDRIIVHAVAPNGGKAEAVRAGVLHVAAPGAWPIIGYWDADLSTPLDEVDRLLAVLRDNPGCQLAMGSRVKRLGSRIDRRVSRHVLGRMFAACASGILGFPVYDSQCGAKLFRRESADVFFRDAFLTRWLFDLEMLARLRNAVGMAAMEMTREVPLGRWEEVGGSKLRLRDMIHVPIELLKIRSYYNNRAARAQSPEP
jgi:glycosyltransferase involved in cell wall biosynthesis